MFAYLKKLVGKRPPAPALRAARSKPRGRARLGLEVLEDRQVPSGFALDMADPHHLIATSTNSSDVFHLDAPAVGKPTLLSVGPSSAPVSYTGSLANINRISFVGIGGSNQAILTVHGAGDGLNFQPNGYHLALHGDHADLQEVTNGNGYTFDVTNVPAISASGDAQGTVNLYASSGVAKNFYVGTPSWSNLDNSLSHDSVSGFAVANCYSLPSAGAGTPSDVADLYGAGGVTNHFIASAQAGGASSYGAIMFSPNPNFATGHQYDSADGFLHVTGHAVTQNDIADFRGSKSTINTYVSHGGSSVFTADSTMSDGTYFFEGIGFSSVGAEAGTSFDGAYLYGSTSLNILVFNPAPGGHMPDARLWSSTHSDEVEGFAYVSATAGTAADVVLGNNLPGTTVSRHVSGVNPWGYFYTVDAYGFN
jgi:hypothetical protein